MPNLSNSMQPSGCIQMRRGKTHFNCLSAEKGHACLHSSRATCQLANTPLHHPPDTGVAHEQLPDRIAEMDLSYPASGRSKYCRRWSRPRLGRAAAGQPRLKHSHEIPTSALSLYKAFFHPLLSYSPIVIDFFMMVDKVSPTDPRIEFKSAQLNGVTYSYILAEPQGKAVDTIFLIHGWPDLAFGWR